MPFDLCKIGQLLKNAREEKGLTQEEISHALCIRKSMIGAIECGDWQSLPHFVYVRGYATQYASFVDALDLIQAELASEEVSLPQEERQTPCASRPPAPKHRAFGFKAAAAVGMAGIVVAFLIFENTQRPAYVAPVPQYQTIQNGYSAVAAEPAGASSLKAVVDTAASDQKVAVDPAASYQKVAVDPAAGYQKVAADPAASAYDNQEEKLVLDKEAHDRMPGEDLGAGSYRRVGEERGHDEPGRGGDVQCEREV